MVLTMRPNPHSHSLPQTTRPSRNRFRGLSTPLTYVLTLFVLTGWGLVVAAPASGAEAAVATTSTPVPDTDGVPGSDTVGVDTFDEVLVVSATGQETPLEDVVLHVQVLDETDVEASASVTVADFLRSVAGFSLLRQTSSMASHPTTQSVSLRGIGGTGASRTLVLFDGVPLNDPFAGLGPMEHGSARATRADRGRQRRRFRSLGQPRHGRGHSPQNPKRRDRKLRCVSQGR